MKKLLSLLAVSTLVGTSTSSLKPVFTNNIVSHGFKSNQLNNKDISIQGENDKNPFALAQINSKIKLDDISVSPNGTVYAIFNGQLNKSNDNGYSFLPVTTIPDKYSITNIAIAANGIIYLGTSGLLKINTDGSFEKVKDIPDIAIWSLTIDEYGKIYAGSGDGIVYKSTDGNTFAAMTGTSESIFSLATDKDGNVYAGTGDSNSNGIVYKSTDGNTFVAMNYIGTNGSVGSLATDKDGNIYVGANNYSGSKNGNVYKSNGTNAFTAMTGTSGEIRCLATDKDGNIYVGTDKGLYKSNGINEFIIVDQIPNDAWVSDIAISYDGTIYVTTQNKGLYVTNPINLLLKINKPDTFDKSWLVYKAIVYNSVQKIDIKEQLVSSARLDNKSITIPTIDLDIPVGEHTLVLTLKNKSLASVFGGDPITGQVIYKLWVKTKIIDTDKIYSTNDDDTDLTDLSLGFISNFGNTNNCPIIETKSKDGTGIHDAFLIMNFNDKLIDFDNSFYVQGNVDVTTNDFTETGTYQNFSKNLSIKKDGIYHLHLVDIVGNTYDSYLELGKDNWLLKGTFNDDTLNRLKTKLNVSLSLTDPKQLAQATGWLTNYDKFTSNLFVKSLQENGKGFDQDIKKDLENDFKWFLKPLTYEPNNEPNFNDGIDKNKLNNEIIKIAEQKLQDGLSGLPQNLNVDIKNVVNKSTLDNYSVWIKSYQDFVNNNKDTWINYIVNIASRGFATPQQLQDIKNHIAGLDFKNYLKHIVWTANSNLSTSNDYQQFVELDKLQQDTITWVNQNIPEINTVYQDALNQAESGLNLHGYSVDEILNDKKLPQTKSQIDNFADGQSFHDWLQSQANIKFHGWQLKIGLPIGLISLIVAVIAGCFVYRRTNPKYHGYWRGKKEDKKEDKLLIKSIKSPKKENKN